MFTTYFPVQPPTPVSTFSISYFEPHAGGCAWYKLAPTTRKERKLAQLHTDCSVVHAAVAPNGEQAIVWIGKDVDGRMQWLVDVKAAQSRKIPPPQLGELRRYAYDEKGVLRAFTVNQEIKVTEVDGVQSTKFRGRIYQMPPNDLGLFSLVHSYIWGKDRWELEDTEAAACCTDGSPELYSLDRYKEIAGNGTLLSLQSVETLLPYRAIDPINDPKSLNTLRKFAKNTPRQGLWGKLALREWHWDLLIWRKLGTPAPMTGHIVLQREGELSHLQEWPKTSSDLVSLQVQDRYALLAEAYTGMYPRIYDMKENTLVYKSDDAQGVWIWPRKTQLPLSKSGH